MLQGHGIDPKIFPTKAKNNDNPYNGILIYCLDNDIYPEILPMVENNNNLYNGVFIWVLIR